MGFLNKEELNNYLNEYCEVTCAHTKATCGNTCCTPNDDELYQFDRPKKLKLRDRFMLFLADFKASRNK